MHPAPRSTTLGTLGNLLWLVFAGGIPLCLTYLLASAVLAVTIVGFPFAVAAWRLGLYALLPFDRQVVARRDGLGSGLLGLVFNLLWLVLFGWAIALAHLVCAVGCAVTVVGIPFALAHWRLAGLALWPFGREVL